MIRLWLMRLSGREVAPNYYSFSFFFCIVRYKILNYAILCLSKFAFASTISFVGCFLLYRPC